MIDKTKRIVKKLPKDLQEEFNKDYAINPKYSHKWENWALDIIERLNTARDNGFITPEERDIVFNDIFDGYIVSKIGSNPQINEKKFWEMMFYDGEE